MSENPTLQVEERSDFGKGFARRARANQQIPAVIYGHGVDPIHVLLPYHQAFLLVKDNSNAVVSLQGMKKPAMALVKDIQRHPVKRTLMHMDLLLVKAGEKVSVEVPLVIVGEPAPGMVATQDLLNIEINVPVAEIPEFINVDVEGLENGTVLSVSDLKLDKDVEAITDPESIVLTVAEPQEASDTESGDAAPEDGEESSEQGSED